MVEAEQEVHLDDMLSSLQRLGVMGQQVGEELEQQKVLLGQLDEDMDDTGDRMHNVMRKLDKLIGTSSNFLGSTACLFLKIVRYNKVVDHFFSHNIANNPVVRHHLLLVISCKYILIIMY